MCESSLTTRERARDLARRVCCAEIANMSARPITGSVFLSRLLRNVD